MIRLTRKLENESFYIANTDSLVYNDGIYSGTAIDKLAKFEDIYDNLLQNQVKISFELEKLRGEGKKNSVKFKELLVKKFNNSNMLAVFKAYGLYD